jgi:hypothetical protein
LVWAVIVAMITAHALGLLTERAFENRSLRAE